MGWPLKGRHDAEKKLPVLFIGQSTRSNYCAVYSTGMLLSILGEPITRGRVLRLFNLKRSNPEYEGADHSDIGSVFAREARVSRWRWDCHNVFNFASVSQSLRTHLRKTACPTLLLFGIIHKNGKWKAKHAAVATAASAQLIQLLDPLSANPKTGRANVWLQREHSPDAIRVSGNSYLIDVKGKVAVLRWTGTS